MFGLSPDLLALLKTLGEYQNTVLRRAVMDAAQGVTTTPEKLAAWLDEQMVGWSPEIKGRPLSDPETRKAAARFMAGVAHNFAFPKGIK